MRELTNDNFYQQIQAYNRCIIDYCLIENDEPYTGYSSHRDAVLFAMYKMNERYSGEINFESEAENAEAEPIDAASFLYAPAITAKDYNGKPIYDCPLPDPTGGGQIPYWYAFLNTPHGTGYGPEDFNRINEVLFPNGAESLEVYEWNTNWSSYFDDGHEWWGAACWSVYDSSLKRYLVVLASTTD